MLENSGIIQIISFSGRSILYGIIINIIIIIIIIRSSSSSRSQWPCGLKAWVCGPSLTGIADSNPAAAIDVCLLWVLYVFRIQVYALGLSLVQRSPTECRVSARDRETSLIRRLWPIRGFCAMENYYYSLVWDMLNNSVSHYAPSHFIPPSCRLSASLYSSRTAAHPSGILVA